MGNVIFNMSMSLDGFVAEPNDNADRVHGWYFAGDTELKLPGGDAAFLVSAGSAKMIQQSIETTGAIVTGRRTFDVSEGWGGHPPLGVHHFVLTHHVPQEWVKPGSPFTFVTDGIASAIARAKKHAGNKNVVLSSPSALREALKQGLVDEITIDLIPVLLDKGIPLFRELGIGPTTLEQTSVVPGIGVTHLRYRVVK